MLPLEGPNPPSLKGKKAAKHSPEEIALKDKIVATFTECCLAKKRVEPTLSHTGDHVAAFKLLKNFGVEEACSIVRRAWEVDNAPLIRTIAANPDKYRGKVPANGSGKKHLYRQDVDGRSQPVGRDFAAEARAASAQKEAAQ